MNCLNYLIRNDINSELDELIIKWLMIAKEHDNKPCKKCGLVQGTLNFGVEKYYCEHITKLVDNKLKKEKKEITKKIFLFTTCQDNQKNL